MGKEASEDVSKKSQCKPFEDFSDEAVRAEDNKTDNEEREKESDKERGKNRKKKLSGSDHGGKVGTDINGVSRKKKKGDGEKKPFRIVTADSSGKAMF